MTAPDLDLDAIRARLEAATPGPWEAGSHEHGQVGCRCVSCYDTVGWFVDHRAALDCGERVAARTVAGQLNDFGKPLVSCDHGPLLSWEDAHFAAEARTDVPALLAEVERLRAEVEAADQRGYRRGRLDAAWAVLELPTQLGDNGWAEIERKAIEAGWSARPVRDRRRRNDFTTLTIEAAYQAARRMAVQRATYKRTP